MKRSRHFVLFSAACALGVFSFGCGEGGMETNAATGKTDPQTASAPAPAMSLPAPSIGRKINFAAEQSLGIVKARPIGKTSLTDWRPVGEAFGEVAIPADSEAMFEAVPGSNPNLAPLTTLGPKDLQEIVLEKTLVGDEQISLIDGMTTLIGLNLNGTKITDAGLSHLSGLTSLKKLGLGETALTGVGLEALQALPGLEKIWLHGTQITDDSLAKITNLPNLKQLVLSKTPITDAGLANLKGLPMLETLVLEETSIGDAGLKNLKPEGLPALKTVVVKGTKVTGAGLDEARKIFPNCQFTMQ